MGRLRDDRPWAAGGAQPEHVHDMVLEVTVRRPELVIAYDAGRDAALSPRRVPGDRDGVPRAGRTAGGKGLHPGGPGAVRSAARLHPPRVAGSAHRAGGDPVAPVVGAADRAGGGRGIGDGRGRRRWFADSCHVWASEGPGPGMQKLALGWRPGWTAYPAPSAVALRRSVGSGSGEAAGGTADRSAARGVGDEVDHHRRQLLALVLLEEVTRRLRSWRAAGPAAPGTLPR